MSEFITVGLDLAKNVFQVPRADGADRAVLRKKLRRAQVLEFFSKLPAYLKPFVKRQKNDMADAEAICEAATWLTMRFVPVKSEDA